jgi:hypothetical protein
VRIRTRQPIRAAALAGLIAASLAAGSLAASPASAAEPTVGQATVGGLHNSYEKSAFPYFADALSSGARLVELDVWTTFSRWYVSHSNPLGNDNNCAKGTTRNQDLRSCVDNIRAWHDANPGHQPLFIKLELKAGFQDDQGYGPDELDAVFSSRLGGAMYRPADLLAGGQATPDAAAKANAWAGMSAMRGRVILTVLKGTVENDSLPTDVEYAGYLRAHPTTAVGWPIAKRESATGDPRTRYAAELRPWFVVFDGDASSFAALTAAQRAFYVDNRYLFIADDAHAVPPAIDQRNPTPAQARERLVKLACLGASIVSSDWYTVPGWQGTAPRGGC